MVSDRGENHDETDPSSRRQAQEILGNRHEEVQITDSVHIGYFIQNIKQQSSRRKAVEIRFNAAHKRTKGRAFARITGQQQGGPEKHLQDCHNIFPLH